MDGCRPGPLLDLLWPRPCEICARPAGEHARYLCWDCLAALPLIEAPHCARCGDPVEGAVTGDYLCSLCVDRRPAFDLARSAVRFRGGVRELLHRFKYGDATHLDRDLAMLLKSCVAACYGSERLDAVAFVPLHAVRERSRTYNQARLLAKRLAQELAVPFAPGCLARVRETGSQTLLSMRQRTLNVEGAFQATAPEWIEGRRFLLVDDVMTTGATVAECSRVLKEAGAARVLVVTVARG